MYDVCLHVVHVLYRYDIGVVGWGSGKEVGKVFLVFWKELAYLVHDRCKSVHTTEWFFLWMYVFEFSTIESQIRKKERKKKKGMQCNASIPQRPARSLPHRAISKSEERSTVGDL